MTPDLPPPPPNVIMILADDQGHWAMNCAGAEEFYTPNLDRLAAEGIRFENFFCASPVCSPARATILTGRMPSQHGVHDWLMAGDTTDRNLEPRGEGTVTEYLAGQTGYTDVLAAGGYVCGLSGKWHLGDSHHPQKGFSFWEVHAKGGGPYMNPPMIRDGKNVTDKGYVTDIITDHALTFLDRHGNGDRPFYLGVHYTAPHSPWNRNQHPPEIWDRYFKNASFSANPSGPPHPWAKPLGFPKTEERRREMLAGYYAAVEEMDRNIGRILDWLDANNARSNTLIVFTSDNGMSMGHHGIYGKGNGTFPLNMYDTSVKVPTLISRPGHVPEGRVDEHLLSHYDLMPTLLDYCGFDVPEDVELPGRSFAPLLQGQELPDDRPVVVYDEYGPVRMLRTRSWKYIHRYPDGPHELYDLAQDPAEEDNRIDDPALADRIAAMRSELDQWFERHTAAPFDGRRLPVEGQGQIRMIRGNESDATAFEPHDDGS